MRRGIVIAAVATLAALMAFGCGGGDATATARHDALHAQPRGNPVVARGQSPRGVPWRIRAKRDGQHFITVNFGGWFAQVPFPLPDSFVLNADTGWSVAMTSRISAALLPAE